MDSKEQRRLFWVLLHLLFNKSFILLSTPLQKLVNDYYCALKAQNITDILACFHLPCTLMTPDRLVLLSTVEEAEQEFLRIFTRFNEVGIKNFKALTANYAVITDNIITLNIDWQFFSSDNRMLADFTVLYHIVKNHQQLKIFQVLSHQSESVKTLPFSLNLIETVG